MNPRQNPMIEIDAHDGRIMQYNDGVLHVVLIADALHHVVAPELLRTEVALATGHCLIIKDHKRARPLARTHICFLD